MGFICSILQIRRLNQRTQAGDNRNFPAARGSSYSFYDCVTLVASVYGSVWSILLGWLPASTPAHAPNRPSWQRWSSSPEGILPKVLLVLYGDTRVRSNYYLSGHLPRQYLAKTLNRLSR